MIPTVANGQPALIGYGREADGCEDAHGVQVLTFDGSSIAHVVSFNDPDLVATFGFPPGAARRCAVAMNGALTANSDVGLLRRAVNYTLSSVDAVSPDLLSRPTPCSQWDLQMLLEHANESIAALHEGLDSGQVGMFSPSRLRHRSRPGVGLSFPRHQPG